jgi:hypothetical protein
MLESQQESHVRRRRSKEMGADAEGPGDSRRIQETIEVYVWPTGFDCPSVGFLMCFANQLSIK